MGNFGVNIGKKRRGGVGRERERETERQRQKQRQRHRVRETETETERERDRERDRDRGVEGQWGQSNCLAQLSFRRAGRDWRV